LNYIADGSSPNEDWLEREKSLTGFSWRGGSERDTDGIIFWSQPIVVKVNSSFKSQYNSILGQKWRGFGRFAHGYTRLVRSTKYREGLCNRLRSFNYDLIVAGIISTIFKNHY
jgi:hypothetical protein